MEENKEDPLKERYESAKDRLAKELAELKRKNSMFTEIKKIRKEILLEKRKNSWLDKVIKFFERRGGDFG